MFTNVAAGDPAEGSGSGVLFITTKYCISSAAQLQLQLQLPPLLLCAAARDSIVARSARKIVMFLVEQSTSSRFPLVARRHLIWLDDDAKHGGHAITFPSILMHAVCRDTSTAPNKVFSTFPICRASPFRAGVWCVLR